MDEVLLAVDVGATNLRVAVGTPRGEILGKTRARTPRHGDELSVARLIVKLAEQLLDGARPEAVGVASIGPLDLRRGWVVNTPNNPLRSFPLREPLREALGAEVILANDCVAAVWGEHIYGAGRGVSDLGYITISTGIGGGFIVDGHLLVGWRGNAHEIGHLVVDYRGDTRCGCGGRGHWEGLASASGLPRLARSLALSGKYRDSPVAKLSLEGRLGAEMIYRYARKGEPFASHVVEEANRIHAAGLASVVAAYDPRLIVLGGAVVINNSDMVVSGIRRYLPDYSIHEPPEIRVTSFGDDAVLMGALAIAASTPPELRRVG